MRRSAVNALGVCAMDPRDDEPETELDRYLAKSRLAADVCREVAAARGRFGHRDMMIFQIRSLGEATEYEIANGFGLGQRRVRQIVREFRRAIDKHLVGVG